MDGRCAASPLARCHAEVSAEARDRVAQEFELGLRCGGPFGAGRRSRAALPVEAPVYQRAPYTPTGSQQLTSTTSFESPLV